MEVIQAQDRFKNYDFVMEQEVLNEYAAGIWADYISYCIEHNINLWDQDNSMAVKTQDVYECKRKIIESGECRSMEDLEPIKEELREMREYLLGIKRAEHGRAIL